MAVTRFFCALLCTVPALLAALFSSAVVQAGEAPATVSGAETINTDQARKLYNAGVVFIDVRSRSKWRLGRIEGARHYELRSTFGLLKHQGFVDREQPLVIYGNGGHTQRGGIAAYLAAQWGYSRVYFYRDGYFSWLASDHPVILSPKPDSLTATILSEN